MTKIIAIDVKSVSKKYSIGKKVESTLRGTIGSLFRPAKIEEIYALEDVTFQINKGECIGVIGNNGAGKSTLLKILSRITSPTSGKIIINGKLSSLLEVGSGFHHELTGRENVFLNGSLLGMSKHEIKYLFEEIVDFSGISKYIDTPVKKYSTGMYMRLAFAVAAHLRSDILLVDEVLAVGDIDFRKKCMAKMDSISKEGKTLLLVSHNLSYISSLCDKSILLENGKLTDFNLTSDIMNTYTTPTSAKYTFKNKLINDVVISSLKDNKIIVSGYPAKIIIKTNTLKSVKPKIIRLEILDQHGTTLMIFNNRLTGTKLKITSFSTIEILINEMSLSCGMYYMSMKLIDDMAIVDESIGRIPFTVHPNPNIRTPNKKCQLFSNYTILVKNLD